MFGCFLENKTTLGFIYIFPLSVQVNICSYFLNLNVTIVFLPTCIDLLLFLIPVVLFTVWHPVFIFSLSHIGSITYYMKPVFFQLLSMRDNFDPATSFTAIYLFCCFGISVTLTCCMDEKGLSLLMSFLSAARTAKM